MQVSPNNSGAVEGSADRSPIEPPTASVSGSCSPYSVPVTSYPVLELIQCCTYAGNTRHPFDLSWIST